MKHHTAMASILIIVMIVVSSITIANGIYYSELAADVSDVNVDTAAAQRLAIVNITLAVISLIILVVSIIIIAIETTKWKKLFKTFTTYVASKLTRPQRRLEAAPRVEPRAVPTVEPRAVPTVEPVAAPIEPRVELRAEPIEPIVEPAVEPNPREVLTSYGVNLPEGEPEPVASSSRPEVRPLEEQKPSSSWTGAIKSFLGYPSVRFNQPQQQEEEEGLLSHEEALKQAKEATEATQGWYERN